MSYQETICPNCLKNPILPAFVWCRWCIAAEAERLHREDKERWKREAIEEAKREEEGEVLK